MQNYFISKEKHYDGLVAVCLYNDDNNKLGDPENWIAPRLILDSTEEKKWWKNGAAKRKIKERMGQ